MHTNSERVPDIRWLDDPEVFAVNRKSAHSDHRHFESEKAYKEGRSCWIRSLDGEWDFHYSENAAGRPEHFCDGLCAEGFDTIRVPGHIELSGYDKIHYINTMYPWEGKYFRRPAYSLPQHGDGAGMFSEAEYNPVGSYRKVFDLEEEFLHHRIIIRFEGVEEAMYLWLNGHFIGYAEDSFTPSEFELTEWIRPTGNVLCVEVHKRSTAAFLEDQDFFRFFGIFRPVTLMALPKVHVEDLDIRPELIGESEGRLQVRVKLSAEESSTVSCSFRLKENAGSEETERLQEEKMISVAAGEVEWTEVSFGAYSLQEVIPWSHKKPYLYELIVEIRDEAGELLELVPYRIGFRRIEIIDKVICLNGKRLVINGVNRHEWSARTGRAIGMEEMKQDIQICLSNNINAVRTCHYPDQIPWYSLCDENGIYLMAETNLESHGSWQKLGSIEPSWNVPGSLAQWREAVLDRAKSNYEYFKNHTSILFWSLGNESYAGENIALMNEYFKQKQDGRLTHYEGVVHNRSLEDRISDVESRMYATPKDIREYLDHSPKKPFLLCEYMHDMGNSLGGMGSYVALLDEYASYHGGFIWDFIDQALFVTDDVTGREVLRYGGDFDDRPSDYEFSGDGLLFADRTLKPAMQEVRYYYGLHE